VALRRDLRRGLWGQRKLSVWSESSNGVGGGT